MHEKDLMIFSIHPKFAQGHRDTSILKKKIKINKVDCFHKTQDNFTFKFPSCVSFPSMIREGWGREPGPNAPEILAAL